jgi:hypothetical protein
MTIHDVMHRVTTDEMATWFAYFTWVNEERRRQNEQSQHQI